MRLFILLVVSVLYLTSGARAQILDVDIDESRFPQKKGWVNDYEGILDDKSEKKLTCIIDSFNRKIGVQICLVTLDSSMVSKRLFDTYTLQLANYWGVGEKGKDNGILIGVSDGHRKMRINNGYGIEDIMSDKETKKIIENYFIPLFKKGEYYEGCEAGIRQIIILLGPRLK